MFKIIIFVFCVCFVVSNVESQSMEELKQQYVQYIMECSKEFPISQNELATVKNKQLPESTSVKCMLACAYKKAGIMNDEGYLWVESIYAFSEKYLSHDAEKLDKAKKFADACRHVNYVDFSGKANSDCERAGLIFKCSVEKASEFDFVV
ncbi:PBP/GOBP family domain-containing protein [Phthorimaea operculella]|nr:PBP/GOBP family domain-containing protein [Phthorimaea operculella]